MNIIRKKNILIKIFSVLIALLINTSIFAQEEITIRTSEWHICEVLSKGKANTKKAIGPFSDKESALANWIYRDFKEDSKYCITKNLTFVTTKPSNYFAKEYKTLLEEYKTDRLIFILKHNVIEDEKIEAAYNKQHAAELKKNAAEKVKLEREAAKEKKQEEVTVDKTKDNKKQTVETPKENKKATSTSASKENTKNSIESPKDSKNKKEEAKSVENKVSKKEAAAAEKAEKEQAKKDAENAKKEAELAKKQADAAKKLEAQEKKSEEENKKAEAAAQKASERKAKEDKKSNKEEIKEQTSSDDKKLKKQEADAAKKAAAEEKKKAEEDKKAAALEAKKQVEEEKKSAKKTKKNDSKVVEDKNFKQAKTSFVPDEPKEIILEKPEEKPALAVVINNIVEVPLEDNVPDFENREVVENKTTVKASEPETDVIKTPGKITMSVSEFEAVSQNETKEETASDEITNNVSEVQIAQLPKTDTEKTDESTSKESNLVEENIASEPVEPVEPVSIEEPVQIAEEIVVEDILPPLPEVTNNVVAAASEKTEKNDKKTKAAVKPSTPLAQNSTIQPRKTVEEIKVQEPVKVEAPKETKPLVVETLPKTAEKTTATATTTQTTSSTNKTSTASSTTKTEDAKKENKTPFTFTSSSTTSSVNRYKKEFLQDYIPQETYVPMEEKPLNQKIENPNDQDLQGRTLLMNAAKSGNEWQIKTLLESGADVNLKDKDGWTALMYACRYQESITTVKTLVEARANVKEKNNFDTSALMLACSYNNNPEILKYLLRFYTPTEKEVLKCFILLLSAKQNVEYIQLTKVNMFIQKSIQLNTFYQGKTPLMYAAQYGNSTKILKLLIDNDALTTIRSSEGKTAFDYASANSNLIHDENYWALNKK